MASSTFTVGLNGFTAPNGASWNMKGLDVDVSDALQNLQGIEANYPGLTAIRLVCNGNTDTPASIQPIVQAYTSKGIVVEIEDHADSQNGDNTGWYTQMAQAYKDNPLVFLETPNEPSASGTAQHQIDIINAIRATGFSNPVSVQPISGWDMSNIPTVTQAVGTSQLFVTPHMYDNSTDPNNAAQYVASDISQAKADGLFPVFDEFGNATDGVTLDPYGNNTIQAVISANESGQAGALFWAAGNGYHPDGADSAFLDPTGSQLTSTGQTLQPWLSGAPPAVGVASGSSQSTPSPNNTVITAAQAAQGASVTDANGNTWSIASNG
ncbi:MAG: cellulase family glycosylhydrolase, partial [Acetobacteraceae bacterium]|nr:cellulase family glycosylhydrolase [Acetobacteraceae bacterium]